MGISLNVRKLFNPLKKLSSNERPIYKTKFNIEKDTFVHSSPINKVTTSTVEHAEPVQKAEVKNITNKAEEITTAASKPVVDNFVIPENARKLENGTYAVEEIGVFKKREGDILHPYDYEVNEISGGLKSIDDLPRDSILFETHYNPETKTISTLRSRKDNAVATLSEMSANGEQTITNIDRGTGMSVKFEGYKCDIKGRYISDYTPKPLPGVEHRVTILDKEGNVITTVNSQDIDILSNINDYDALLNVNRFKHPRKTLGFRSNETENAISGVLEGGNSWRLFDWQLDKNSVDGVVRHARAIAEEVAKLDPKTADLPVGLEKLKYSDEYNWAKYDSDKKFYRELLNKVHKQFNLE